MSWVYCPKVTSSGGGTSYNLPQPIMQWEPSYPRAGSFHTIPGTDGESVYGLRKAPAQVRIRGIIHGTTVASVLSEYASMESFFDSYQDNFRLYRYYDSGTGDAEYYKECVLLNMSDERSNKPLLVLPYSLDIRILDPTRYTSAGAASGDETINGELTVNLQDTLGVKRVRINNSDGTTVAVITSDGSVILKGNIVSSFRGTL